MRTFVAAALLFAFFSGLIACAPPEVKTKTQFLEIDDFDSYMSPAKADSKIQEAARAVVRVGDTYGPMGTGFLISADGRMMTNNHIIGESNCTEEGCNITIDLDYQNNIGFSADNKKELYAEPIFTSKHLDYTIVQLYETDELGAKTTKFQAPHHVKFTYKTGQNLLKQKLFVVGHPMAMLKKIKTMIGYELDGRFLTMDDYVFGGNSGSPVFNNEGEVVAILHSGRDSSETISLNGLQGDSYSTPTSEIVEDMGLSNIDQIATAGRNDENISENFISLFKEEFKLPEHLHLTESFRDRPVINVQEDLFPNLFEKVLPLCEEDTAVLPNNSRDFATKTRSCYEFLSFLDCSEGASPLWSHCPTGDKWERWNKIADRMITHSLSEFSEIDKRPMLLKIKLRKDPSKRQDVLKEVYNRYLETQPVMNFTLAKELFDFRRLDYKDPETGKNAYQFLVDFRKNPFHHKSLKTIAAFHLELFQDEPENLSQAEVMNVFRYVMSHRDLTARARLSLESMAYEMDLLKLL